MQFKLKVPTHKEILAHIKDQAQCCPICKAEEKFITCQDPENEDGVVVQCCSCLKCHSSWTECYHLTDITEVELGTPKKKKK